MYPFYCCSTELETPVVMKMHECRMPLELQFNEITMAAILYIKYLNMGHTRSQDRVIQVPNTVRWSNMQ